MARKDGKACVHTAIDKGSATRRPVRCCFLVALALTLSTLACAYLPTAPIRSIPTLSPRMAGEILEFPERACLGEVVTFTLQTVAGNECGIQISTWTEDERVSQRLTPLIADAEGICSWQWEVPADAPPSDARIDVSVQYENEINSLVPQGFQLDRCDE